MRIDLPIDAGRVLFGLSRIGYTTASALCDIIDNSVRAGAHNITLCVRKLDASFISTRRNNIKEYILIDDGCGMTEEGIKNALMLGSSDMYEAHSLSKSGLGLKSASFSQGDTLTVISAQASGKFVKYVVTLPAIIVAKEYFATREDLTIDDQLYIDKYLPKGKGTIIRVGDIRLVNHPSVKSTIEELRQKLGVIYYYFLQEDLRIAIEVEGDKTYPIAPFDVLFTEEANANGNLNEYEWDGKTTRWITRTKRDFLLDKEANVKATIEITQLPHPPSLNPSSTSNRGEGETRKKYRIGAGNYGFYIYRNKRLISWAQGFDGIIPVDQNLYSFRGRILIDDSADESFNIDVKKSTITLSDEAWNSLNDFTHEPKRKSRKAWERAGALLVAMLGQEPNKFSNDIAESFTPAERLPGTQTLPESEIESRAVAIANNIRKRLKEAIRVEKEVEPDALPPAELEEIAEEVLKGSPDSPATRIFRVSAIADNHLWEPYYDAENGVCVRINRGHRFAKLIFEESGRSNRLQVIFDLLLLQLAQSEIYFLKNYDTKNKLSIEEMQKLTDEYRRITSEQLADICRKAEEMLNKLQD